MAASVFAADDCPVQQEAVWTVTVRGTSSGGSYGPKTYNDIYAVNSDQAEAKAKARYLADNRGATEAIIVSISKK
jgi:hypothetical protein